MNQDIDYRNDHGKHKRQRLFWVILVVVLLGILGVYFYSFNTSKPTPTQPQLDATSSVQSTTDNDIPPVKTNPIVVTSTTNTSTTTKVATSSQPLSYNFGMAVGETLLGLTPQNLNNRLNAIAALGVSWIRFDINWDHIQLNNSSTYNWYAVDQLVAAANARHIKLLPILDYTPLWARTPSCSWAEHCPPASDTAYGVFVQAAVERYAPQGISDWEIWNEPNLAYSWENAASATQYVQLLKVAYATIKKVEPSSTVITGGLAPSANDWQDTAPVTFLQQMYKAGAKGYFDAVGDHPYTFPALPSSPGGNAWAQMSGVGTSPSLRSVMIANGDGDKKIWVTEFGAPTNGPTSTDHVSEAVQAETVTDAFQLYEQYSWGGPFFWYSFQDLGVATNTNENFFGIIRHDGSTKPAYTVLKNIISESF